MFPALHYLHVHTHTRTFLSHRAELRETNHLAGPSQQETALWQSRRHCHTTALWHTHTHTQIYIHGLLMRLWVGRQATSCQCVCVCVLVREELLISELSWWQQTRVKLCWAALSVCVGIKECRLTSLLHDMSESWKHSPNHFWGTHNPTAITRKYTHTHTQGSWCVLMDCTQAVRSEAALAFCFLFVEQMLHNDTHRRDLEPLHLKSTGNSLCGFIACSP